MKRAILHPLFATILLLSQTSGSAATNSVEPARPLKTAVMAKPFVPAVDPVPEIPKSVNPMGDVAQRRGWRNLGDLMKSGGASRVVAKGRLYEQSGQLADALKEYFQIAGRTILPDKELYPASVFASSRIIAIYYSAQLTRKELEQIAVPLPKYLRDVPSPISRTQLGDLYWEGRVVQRDELKAAAWYLRAAQADDPSAMSRLAEICRQGISGGKPDRPEAVRWFRCAARLGHGPSQLELGRAYLEGDGIEKNPRLAVKWLRKASVLGETDAVLLLKTAESQLTAKDRLKSGIERADKP